MRLRGLGLAVGLVMMLVCGFEVAAEIYVWTDAQGVVHMTDQWVNVPEAMRARVIVRESSAAPASVPPSPQPSAPQSPPTQDETFPQPRQQIAPEPTATPVPEGTSSPPASSNIRDYSWFIPRHRPFIHSPKRVDPPFPYDVRLDPHDRNFVWVGPNRVPKDLFTYPRIPLEKQAQFQQRLRDLERRRPSHHHQPTQQSSHR